MRHLFFTISKSRNRADLVPVRINRSVDHGTREEKKMPLINLIIILVAVGVILWLVNNYIPMDRKIKSILNVVVVIVVILLGY